METGTVPEAKKGVRVQQRRKHRGRKRQRNPREKGRNGSLLTAEETKPSLIFPLWAAVVFLFKAIYYVVLGFGLDMSLAVASSVFPTLPRKGNVNHVKSQPTKSTMMSAPARSVVQIARSSFNNRGREGYLLSKNVFRRHDYGSAFATLQQSHGIHTGRLLDRDDAERRRQKGLPVIQAVGYHSSAPQQNAVTIMLGLGAVSASFYAAATAVRAYNEYQASIPETPPEEEKKEEVKEEKKKEKKEEEGPRENIFSNIFSVGSKYYEGGFEETMTRREAALILGVRESSSPRRVKDAHRKLLILNHPDTGGSTYLAGKLNEAKELLLKGRRS